LAQNVTINISGSGDPNAVAQAVKQVLQPDFSSITRSAASQVQ
jgi:hypothetical protein